jgi:hypothetical protein
VAHARRHHPQPPNRIPGPSQCRVLSRRTVPDEHNPPACSNTGSVFRKPTGTPAQAYSCPAAVAIGRATAPLKSRYRTGNSFPVYWRIRPMAGPGSRLCPEPASQSRPLRVTIPCVKIHCMSRRFVGRLIDRGCRSASARRSTLRRQMPATLG